LKDVSITYARAGAIVKMTMLQDSEILELKETFRAFSQLSETLEHSYTHLEDRIAQLQLQLEDVHAERHREHQERDLLADRLNSILNALPAGVVVLDPQGKIKVCNPAAVSFLEGPLTGEYWLDVVNRVFDLSNPSQDEIQLKDGRYVSLSTCPLGNDPGQVILISDITENKRLHDKLNQHQRLKAIGEMAAGLAHQIRTPLSSAILCCSQLKNIRLPIVKRKTILDKVMGYMGDLEKVVNNMLVFSRAGYAGDEQINVEELIRHAITALSDSIENTHTDIHVQCNAQLQVLIGNRAILASAIQNIISNAIQAMGNAGELNINIETNQSGCVDIVFIDNGPGVELEIRDKIFNPFFTTKSKGTGLGLAVVQTIARAHEGEIWFPDEQPVQGSKFILRLPAIESGKN